MPAELLLLLLLGVLLSWPCVAFILLLLGPGCVSEAWLQVAR